MKGRSMAKSVATPVAGSFLLDRGDVFMPAAVYPKGWEAAS
jgi:hypothetical protein